MFKCPNCNTELAVIKINDTGVTEGEVKVPTFTSPLAIRTVVLDAGHGARNLETGDRSEAMTRVYKFPHNGKIIYEGEINRLYTKVIKRKLAQVGIDVVETAPTYKDTSLRERVAISNQQDSKSAYFLSIHNNGSTSHKATGAEGYTSLGQNRSDSVMESILTQLAKVTKLRADNKDGDLDKEANYYVIKHTKLRAGLLEIGFYDNWQEYKKLIDEEFINRVSDAIVKGIVDYNKSLEK